MTAVLRKKLLINLSGKEPSGYYFLDGKAVQAIEAHAYYTNIIEPHIVEEFDSYVVVNSTSMIPAIWQAGEYNLSQYNNYLQSARYWDSIPIVGSLIYPPPAELKFVRIQAKE